MAIKKGEGVGHYEPNNFLPQRISKDFYDVSQSLNKALTDPRSVFEVWQIISPNYFKKDDSLSVNYNYDDRKTAATFLFPHLIKGATDSDTATHNLYMMPIPKSESLIAMGPVQIFEKLSLLLSPRPKYNSDFLKDEQTVTQRMEMFNYLRPVFNALLSNPDLKNLSMESGEMVERDGSKYPVERPLSYFIADLLRDIIEYEFFPHGERAKEIPIVNREERFELAKQLIEIQGQIADSSLESDTETLSLAVLNTFLILGCPFFEDERMELIKQGIPVFTKILGNPELSNDRFQASNILSEFATMMNPNALRYSDWELNREKRFIIAELVLRGLADSLKTGNFNGPTTVNILETIEAVNFCSQFTDDQKRELLVLSLPLLESIAGSEAVKEQEVANGLFHLIDFTLDKQGIKAFKAIVEGLKDEGVEAFQRILGTETKDRRELAKAFKDEGFGELQRMKEYAQSFVDISKRSPSLGEVPRLILTLEPDDQRRNEMLPIIMQIIKTLSENNHTSGNRIVSDLLPMTAYLYRWYSNQIYQVPPSEVTEDKTLS